ncbi:hypothetical protein AMTRI_Chr09g35700 [Amborella trichopoda]|uniref:Uncharacterized protein n=1 Tax=Amborella trichopoda TaxID=13333 RepID=W1NLL6_AMBTC|nr:uncharacterized protein LOC18424323 [Amborella trichopoda]ERM96391.1 hypothetical protein AMTR_s00001p00238630 [Amborella trichopoda]|eukprot:XP_006828975.1 uncharacterized protein LOC18424323 [Amborella trichopoda]
MAAPMPYHVRSNSMPSGTHPLFRQLNEKLLSINDSAQHTAECLADSLLELYDVFDDLLQLPQTLDALHSEDKSVNEMLDDSLNLLDVCSVMRDAISRLREQHQIILSFLRRRDYTRMEGQAHVSARRKMNKELEKCLSTLKRTFRSISSQLPQNHSIQNEEVEVALSQVGSASLFVCESHLLRFKTPKKRKSIISTILRSKSRQQNEGNNESECANASICALYTHSGKVDETCAKDVQRKLASLDKCMRNIDDRLGCINNRLIRSRVSLLNIITN